VPTTIGICVHAEPQRLKAMLVSLHACAPAAAVMLLPDGAAAAATRLNRP
jgi:hypothetical protein